MPTAAPPPPPGARARIAAEIAIVLALSLGASAVYAVVQFVDHLTHGPLRTQSTALNPRLSDRAVFDAIYQILPSILDLAPVALVCWLLWSRRRPHLRRLGIDGAHPARDALVGVGLALGIGGAGIGVYLGGLALGLTVRVDAAPGHLAWWSVPVLVLSAFRSGATEEVIVIGYLYERLGELGWRRWTIILAAAAFRGSYHLYQGVSAFLGNAAMGIVFGWLYTRTRRVLPLVIAHTLIDSAVYLGYPWASSAFPQLFGR